MVRSPFPLPIHNLFNLDTFIEGFGGKIFLPETFFIFLFVINLFDLGGSDNLVNNNYNVENLIDFPGH